MKTNFNWLRFDRSGITRTVVLIGPFAVKVPSLRYSNRWRGFLRGLLANMQERDLRRNGSRELCPVLFSLPGGFLVVMRRAHVMNDEEFSHLDLDAFDERTGVSVERKATSFGWLDGRVVALDFGGFAK